MKTFNKCSVCPLLEGCARSLIITSDGKTGCQSYAESKNTELTNSNINLSGKNIFQEKLKLIRSCLHREKIKPDDPAPCNCNFRCRSDNSGHKDQLVSLNDCMACVEISKA